MALSDWTYEVADDVPGGVRFYDEKEKPTLLTGAPAQEFAARIDATKRNLEAAKGMGEQKTAENNWAGGLNDWATDAGGAPSEQQSSVEIERKGQEALQKFGGAFNAGPTQTASAQTAPTRPVQEGGAQRGNPLTGLRPHPLGFYEDPSGGRWVPTGGRAAITQEQREATAKTGTPTPTAQTTTVEGGFAPDQGFLKRQREIALDRVDAATDAQIRMADISQRQARLNQELVAQKADALKREQDIQAEIAKRVEEDRAYMVKAREEFASKKVDPNRMFRGGEGTLRSIGMAIAAGLGAFGATLGKTENFAQNTINSIIDRDIAAQEAEIKTLGITADNALSQLHKSTGDLNQAKALLRTIALEHADAQRAELSDAFQTEAQMQASENLRLGIMDQLNKDEELYNRLSQGKNVKHVQEQYLYPQAGVRPGMRRLSIDENIKIDKAIGEGMKTEADVLKTGAEAAKTSAEAQRKASGEELTPEQIDYNKRIQAVDSAKGQIEALATRYGYEVDKATGALKLKDKGDGFPRNWADAVPTETLSSTLSTSESKKLKTDLTSLGVAFGRVINDGGEPSADLARRMIPQWDATTAPNDLAAQLESNYQNLLQRENAIKAGSTAGARGSREGQREQTAAERASTKKVDLKPE